MRHRRQAPTIRRRQHRCWSCCRGRTARPTSMVRAADCRSEVLSSEESTPPSSDAWRRSASRSYPPRLAAVSEPTRSCRRVRGPAAPSSVPVARSHSLLQGAWCSASVRRSPIIAWPLLRHVRPGAWPPRRRRYRAVVVGSGSSLSALACLGRLLRRRGCGRLWS